MTTKRITPSLVVSILALIVATTGTGIAATKINGRDIKNHSITANKLAKGAVTRPAVANRAITKAALADGVIVNNTVLAPAGPKGDPGTPGTNGAPGATGANGTALAWGTVAANGTPAQSSGNATVTHPALGRYCITAPGSVIVVTPMGSSALDDFSAGVMSGHLSCSAGTFEVYTGHGAVVADENFTFITA